MNYLLSFVVLCFLLSGCATPRIQLNNSDNAQSLRTVQTAPSGDTAKSVSARAATSDVRPEAVNASFSGALHPDQF